MNTQKATRTIYDYPLYYDILFGWDRDAEANFYDTAFQHHGAPRGGSIIETGCGTGQVAVRLAKHEWHVTGLDKRPEMLTFLEKTASESGVTVQTVCADMTDFTLRELQDGAYCPMSSFRILPDDQAALSHLRAIANVLRLGGTYILDMAFEESSVRDVESSEDGWVMHRGNIKVRTEGEKIYVEDTGRAINMILSWGSESKLRKYSSGEFINLVKKTSAFAIEAWHPPAQKTKEGVDIFDIEHRKDPPVTGRAMVVLKRPLVTHINL